MQVPQEQLETFLLDSNIVSRDDLAKARVNTEQKNEDIGNALVSMGVLGEDDLRNIQAQILGIPFINLEGKKIDFATLSLIPEPIARNYNVVAYKKNDDTLEVAMLDTDNLGPIEFIRKKVGLKILPRLTDSTSIKHALTQYQKSLKAEFGDIIQQEAASLSSANQEGDETVEVSESDLKKMAEDLPVVRIVDALLKHAILQSASDIHIEPMEDQVLVRYRIDGILHDAMVLPKHAGPSITARVKVLANLKLDEKRLPQDGRFKVETDTEKVSFRVSILPIYFGEKTVMRLLREGSTNFTLEQLGFHGQALEDIHNALRQKTGIVLTTGPTGSGKTTTLYTLLDMLNTPDVNISTIEDPVEYQIPRVNQTQVRPDIGFSFSNGLRSLMRQDPDIIMVGEIRDNETASLATNASLTGHLVFSTLHTNSSAGAIPRLIDMHIEPFLLVSVAKVIIGQRLLRKLCDVKEEYFLNSDELASLARVVDLDRIISFLKKENIVEPSTTWKNIPFYRAKPSEACEDGYRGRIGIYEVFRISQTVRELIIRGATTHEIEEQAKTEGMMTMIEDGIFKAAQGLTTIEEVLRVVSE